MVGLDKIQLFQPSTPSDNDGTNFYAPIISSFNCVLTDVSKETGTPYLSINLREYSTDLDTQFRGIYIKGMLRSSVAGSNLIPSTFEKYFVIAAVDSAFFFVHEKNPILLNPDVEANNELLGAIGYTYGVGDEGTDGVNLYSYDVSTFTVDFYIPTEGSTTYNISGIYYSI